MSKTIPKSLRDIDKWMLSRRKFIKATVLAGIASQIPFFNSCIENSHKKSDNELDSHQNISLESIFMYLFPDDGFGPSAKSINALNFFHWTLKDPQITDEDKTFIINGINWIDEACNEKYLMDFISLDSKKQKLVLIKISNVDWGETWLSLMMTMIIEALLSHPLYGGNTNESGWKWLNHFSGNPQPNSELLYPQILETFKYQ